MKCRSEQFVDVPMLENVQECVEVVVRFTPHERKSATKDH